MRRVLLVLCLLAVAGPLAASPSGPAAAAAPPFTASGSVEQVYAYGLGAGTPVQLLNSASTVVDSGTADTAGAYLFHKVTPGSGYQVATAAGTVGALTVTSTDEDPPDSFYANMAATQPISAGFGYLTTRDGTKLSINVTMPNDGSTGPWPVVVNYSGYDPSQPGDPPQEVAFYPYQGYVTVGINLRGTTCSGGAFEFMEDLQGLDGYDAIETLAHQTWSNGHVGMAGISYSGYSQLYVGATNPPHLDAIAPASPFSDTYSGILYPGGILNDGFAVDWATERENDAKPSAHTWVKNRIANGDTTCAQNQIMHNEAKPLLQRIHNTPFADHEFDYLNTETFIHDIKMPTFLSSQWQDEQTGGSAANLIPLFDPATKVYGNFTNGTHVEPMGPEQIQDQMSFIDLYVGHRIPHTASLLTLGMPSILADLFNAPNNDADFALPFNTWASKPSYAQALADWEAQPRISIRWENGGKAGKEGLPLAATQTRYTNWPPSEISAEKLYLQPDGALGASAPAVADTAARASSSYTYDPATKRASTSDGSTGDAWGPHPNYHWDVLKEGNALSFVTAPYTQKVAYAGQGSVDLWLKSSAADTDLEATFTEVRPDGKEVYIQSGWLRASHRTEDPTRSTELVPYQDHQAVDASPLPAGQFTKVRIEMFPFAHVIRPGSRLRVNIEAPGGNQPFWKFETIDGTATNSVGHSTGMPSRIVLPRLPSAPFFLPTALPACTLSGVTSQAVSLRNQPCRDYVPNRVATAVTASAQGGDVAVSWTAPAGTAPDSYTVTPHVAAGAPSGSTAPAAVTVAGSATAATIPAVTPGVPLEVTVTAVYGATTAPASDASLPVTVKPLALRLFGTWNAFVKRQLTDFTGSAPASAVTAGVAALNGGQSAEDYITSLRHGTEATTTIDPVTRLYLAYFQRSPDAAGQAYWVGKRRTGTSLLKVSNSFASSTEFKTKYKSLTNKGFVERVYQNVLGRPGDAAGIAYWTGQLDQHKKSRGQVMLNFSDSSEFKRTSANTVDVINLYFALLRRAPSTTELTTTVARLTAATPLSTIVGELIALPQYAGSIPS
ncbi:CocE/NonD family hydrolase [Aquihabitans sp. McL0605]|uniref:CocE/NonD family hydrolase n=1 Tax=Aquihabitans sp. McL0605 TaxID=3415671 RepID=UPI003CEFE200